MPMTARSLSGIWLACFLAWGQQLTSTWQEDVRRRAEAHDWSAAMGIVDREVARAPQDMDVRAWRARVLFWSGEVAEAELEYQRILSADPNDPDNWMGLASVYSREGRPKEALQALGRLVLAQLEFRRNLQLLKEALTDRTQAEHERERELIKLQQTLTRVLGLNIPVGT